MNHFRRGLILGLLALCAAPHALASGVYGGSNSANAASLALTGVTAGATIVVFPVSSGGNRGSFVCTDAQGSYTIRGANYGNSGDVSAEALTLTNANSGTHTIACSISTDAILGIAAIWYTGVGDVDNSFAAVNGAVVTSGSGANALSSGAFTTTTNGDTVVGFFVNDGSGTALTAGTSPNSFTSRLSGNLGDPFLMQDLTQATAGSIASTGGIASASTFVICIGLALAPTAYVASPVTSNSGKALLSNGSPVL